MYIIQCIGDSQTLVQVVDPLQIQCYAGQRTNQILHISLGYGVSLVDTVSFHISVGISVKRGC